MKDYRRAGAEKQDYNSIQKLRLRVGMTQAEVSVRAGVSCSRISEIENGAITSPFTAKLILPVFGIRASHKNIMRYFPGCYDRHVDRYKKEKQNGHA